MTSAQKGRGKISSKFANKQDRFRGLLGGAKVKKSKNSVDIICGGPSNPRPNDDDDDNAQSRMESLKHWGKVAAVLQHCKRM